MAQRPADDRSSEDARRPYRPPRIVCREQIEAMAASCLQPGSKPDPVLCPSGPIQS